MDKSPQNVGTMRGNILHKYNVGLPGVKPKLHTRVRKCGRLVKSNLGNGRQIRVWEDNWVPGSSTHKVISQNGMLPLDSRVFNFIDVENKCCDWNRLNRTFLPFEAKAITRIPLSVRMPNDRQVWAKTLNSFFLYKKCL